MNYIFLLMLSLAYLFAAYMGPFPYWKSYFRICGSLIRNKDSAIGMWGRLKLGVVLLRIGITSPIYNILWMIDDIFYPSYRTCTIADPVFIVGPPRSGSTFFHRTLVDDIEHFVGVRHFEWRFPFICLLEVFRFTGIEKMISSRSYWPRNGCGSLARKMHSHFLGDFEEDGIFFEERFLFHYFIFRRYPYPELVPYMHDYNALPAHIRERMLSVHEKILKKISYLHGGNRLIVLKENESMQMLKAMARRYPRSKFILLTRMSSSFLSSYVALSRTSTQCKTGIDPKSISGWHTQNIRKRLEECKLQMEFFDQELPLFRQLRLSYESMTMDFTPTMERVFEFLGVTISADYLDRLRAISSRQESRNRGYDFEQMESQEFAFYDDFARDVNRQHKANLRSVTLQRSDS